MFNAALRLWDRVGAQPEELFGLAFLQADDTWLNFRLEAGPRKEITDLLGRLVASAVVHTVKHKFPLLLQKEKHLNTFKLIFVN